jgi:hypothetical protein
VDHGCDLESACRSTEPRSDPGGASEQRTMSSPGSQRSSVAWSAGLPARHSRACCGNASARSRDSDTLLSCILASDLAVPPLPALRSLCCVRASMVPLRWRGSCARMQGMPVCAAQRRARRDPADICTITRERRQPEFVCTVSVPCSEAGVALPRIACTHRDQHLHERIVSSFSHQVLTSCSLCPAMRSADRTYTDRTRWRPGKDRT